MPPTVWFDAHFEGDDLSEFTGSEVNNEGGGGITTSSAHPYAGTYGAVVNLIDAVAGDYARVYKSGLNIGVGNYIFVSTRWYFPSASFNPTASLILGVLYEDSSPYGSFDLGINSDKQLYIYDSINAATYTQTVPISVPLDQHVGIELEVYAHESAGYIKLYQDGVMIIEQTGIDTMPATNYDVYKCGAHYVLGTMANDLIYYFDEVFVQDARKQGIDHKRTINDAIGVTDNLSRAVAYGRSIADSVGVTDVLSRAQAHRRTIDDDVGVSDVLTRAQAHRRTINDNVGVTDTLSRVVAYVRSIADGIGVTDALSFFHHYLGRFYKKTPPSTTWGKAEPPTTEWGKIEPPETDWTKEE